MKTIILKTQNINDIYKFIREEKERKGFSWRILAELSGMSSNGICTITHGTRDTRVNSLIKIINALGYEFVTPDLQGNLDKLKELSATGDLAYRHIFSNVLFKEIKGNRLRVSTWIAYSKFLGLKPEFKIRLRN